MTDWSYEMLSRLILGLGFVGFAGVTLLPLRTFFHMRRNAPLWSSSLAIRVALPVVALAAIAAALIGVEAASQAYHCLAEMRCGPNRASSWISLAVFGACYLSFEAVAVGALAFARRGADAA
jgi:hypothetical protein